MLFSDLYLYHIFIDRFAGWSGTGRGTCFRGGNLRDIVPLLDHVRGLGATGVLLTPFYKGAAYHGYHVTDYEEVDGRFGTWADVDALVAEVHRRGMVIVADFVANHCHETCRLRREHADWFRREKGGGVRCFEGISGLPEFDLDRPDAARYMVERGLDLCRHGFDGLRLDYAKGPSLGFWRRFRRALKSQFPGVFTVGEVWGRPRDKRLPHALAVKVRNGELSVQEAWQMRYEGLLDGVLDFEYQHLMAVAARSGRIAGNDWLKGAVERHLERFEGCEDLRLFLFLDNHDTNRFLYECGGDRGLLDEAVEFTRRLPYPFVEYYGTELGMSNVRDIFDGTPFADARVRQCFPLGRKDLLG